MSSFQVFIDSMENVPPELKRNLTLMTDLDKRTKEIMAQISTCVDEYKKSTSAEKRKNLRNESNELFEKIDGYADDKIELALQTYEIIDRNIKRLLVVGSSSVSTTEDSKDANQVAPIGYDMPKDPNEPIYCICREVSYGEMVACDNKECLIEWFHYTCMNLTSEPKGKWYCPECIKSGIMKKQKKRRSRRNRGHY